MTTLVQSPSCQPDSSTPHFPLSMLPFLCCPWHSPQPASCQPNPEAQISLDFSLHIRLYMTSHPNLLLLACTHMNAIHIQDLPLNLGAKIFPVHISAPLRVFRTLRIGNKSWLVTLSRLDSSRSPCHTYMQLRSHFDRLLCLQVSLSPSQPKNSWVSLPMAPQAMCTHSPTTSLHHK